MTVYYEPLPDRAQALANALSGSNGMPRRATTMLELADLLARDHRQQLVILGPGVPLAEAMSFASEQRRVNPTVGVLLLRDSVDVGVLGEAIRAGVREVIDVLDTGGLRAACARSLEVSHQLAGETPESVQPTSRHGRVVTIFAGTGGCGKSMFATNLSVSLAAEGAYRVLLMDLDLLFGDVAIMLKLKPERSLVDGASMAGHLDDMGLRSLLTPYAPGVNALLAPVGLAESERISKDLVARTLQVARRSFDYIVVDTPPYFSDQVLAALDASDWFVLLATPDMQTAKNLRLTMDMFDQLEYPQERRLVVLNHSDNRVGLTPADIERVSRAPIACQIPTARDVSVAVNDGTPLTVKRPSHPVSRAIRTFAESKLRAPVVSAVPAVAAGGESSGRTRGSLLRRGK